MSGRRQKNIEILIPCVRNITNVEYKNYVIPIIPKTRLIPMVIGALDAEPLLTKYQALIKVMTRKGDIMQQTVALGLDHMLRKVQWVR